MRFASDHMRLRSYSALANKQGDLEVISAGSKYVSERKIFLDTQQAKFPEFVRTLPLDH